MKKLYIIMFFTMSFLALSTVNGYATSDNDVNVAASQTAIGDSTITAIKIKTIILQQEKLKKEIAAQDKKRNANILGVTPETMEQMNDRQDSICLDLRSRLVNLNLELDEVKKRQNAGAPTKAVD